MKPSKVPFAPGMHVLIRDEAWRVLRVDHSSTNCEVLSVVGLTELVRDKEARFSTEFDQVEPLDPVHTELVADDSSHYHRSLLYLESLLRRRPPLDERLHVGHLGALDVMNYQLEPAAMALAQPRQRILIADAVGLGKTLEAGILLSELIARGRARRILVVALKSLLGQFQRELWSRFTIPLVRLDSTGLQRIRQQIPVNHNPFALFDKAIISIDTLKQNNEYRRYLEQSRWDVIVIDEAHNVARRGAGRGSLRSRLASLLATQSDALIMLSATPHDGRAQTFASLMNMLDPTAIADESNYLPQDIKRLYMRRFRKDVIAQLGQHVPQREVLPVHAQASQAEEEAYQIFASLQFSALDQRRGGQHLFKTTLEKSLLSSPAACLETLRHRVARLQRREDAPRFSQDVASLQLLAQALEQVDAASFSKYQRLLSFLRDELGYRPSPKDRLVIFTERIATMRWLAQQLTADLGLKEGELRTLDGGMSDVEQQEVVEAFGQDRDKVRLLVASDVASEGINLHYLCHRVVHFDIPWSLMVFQQRNGRVDRYGQASAPQIIYLLTSPQNPKLKGDERILQILIEKDEQVQKNLGDPSALTHACTPEEEERLTAAAIEAGDPEAFARGFESGFAEANLLDLLALDGDQGDGQDIWSMDLNQPEAPPVEVVPQPFSLFPDDFSFLAQALRAMDHPGTELDQEARRVELEITPELERRLRSLPQELEIKNNRLVLTADAQTMQEAISQARSEASAWPSVQFLWRLHPIFRWVQDKMAGGFGRHSAPVLSLEGLPPGQVVILLSGLIPNQKSQPVLHRWFAATFQQQRLLSLEPFTEAAARLGLGRHKLPNRQVPFDPARLRALLPAAVQATQDQMRSLRQAHQAQVDRRLEERLAELELLKARKLQAQQDLFRDDQARAAEAHRQIDRIFQEHHTWMQQTLKTSPLAFVQVLAVLQSGAGE